MFFFFNDTATTEIYTLSLHDALPIYEGTGSIYTSLSCEPEQTEENLAIVQDVLRAVQREGITEDELRQAKSKRSEEHTSGLQSQSNLVCRLLLAKKKVRYI